MTTFSYQLLSRKTSTPEVWQCGCEYSRRSATVSIAELRMGYAEVVFIQPSGKLDTMWHGAWQRLATRHKVRCGRYKWSLQQDGAPSQTVRNTEDCSVRICSSLSQTFCPPNSPDLNTVNLPSGGALQQTVYQHQSFSSVDKIKRAIVKSIAGTTAWHSHCQFITFITFLWKSLFHQQW